MKRKLFSIILIFLLSSPTWSETLTIDDLVERNNVYYKKFTNVPVTWEVSGIDSGKFVNGKKEGEWLYFYENGQWEIKGNYKDGKKDGFWEYFNRDGSLRKTETWKNRERINCEGDC